ncbi:MAG: IS5 family transposase [Burkholderiales bacterium]|nr:IS5 family transposase [Burkholderiales bacterium]
MTQMTFGSGDWTLKAKVTRRAAFLGEMEKVIPWQQLLALIEPHWPKAATGRPPHPMARMLRIYFMQQWFNLSDPAMEDALYDSEAIRGFAGIDLTTDLVPDESTILRFRRLLEAHRLTAAMFGTVRELLTQKGLLLKAGTIVDATIIAAPSSTQNAAGERDPEMHQTKKGRDWHFGMKVHIGASKQGLTHSLVTGPANEADITRLDELMHGKESELYGDQAYWSEDHRRHCQAAGIRYRVNRRARPFHPLTAHQREINRKRSAHRARGEHAFHVVKRLWGFAKVRYRGLAKNTARAFALFALANLYMVRKRLLIQGARCLQ